MNPSSRFSQLIKILGPGLLYAGAAIGVSHLVQSTRAGANYGFILIWAVIIANVVKYPFFESGPRYAAATGNSLLTGYKNLGKWALIVFLLLTLATMFTIQAAVTVVTAGLAIKLTGIQLEAWQWSGILLLICLVILSFGKYSLLDRLMKIIIVVLAVTTLVALIAALFGQSNRQPEFETIFSFANNADIFFLVALVGWMPAPIDISVWHSVWAMAKKRDLGRLPNMKEALLDFKIGYWGTAILAICFLSLGALVLYGTGESLSPKGGVFAGQLIKIYTANLGDWAYPIIGIAAFTTMFSTTLTCLDAFPRVLRKTSQLLVPDLPQEGGNRTLYQVWILLTVAGTLVILRFFVENMGGMVDFATTLSFVTAPVLAIMNYMVITGKGMPEESKPGALLKVLSISGIIFLTLFSIYYIKVADILGKIALYFS